MLENPMVTGEGFRAYEAYMYKKSNLCSGCGQEYDDLTVVEGVFTPRKYYCPGCLQDLEGKNEDS